MSDDPNKPKSLTRRKSGNVKAVREAFLVQQPGGEPMGNDSSHTSQQSSQRRPQSRFRQSIRSPANKKTNKGLRRGHSASRSFNAKNNISEEGQEKANSFRQRSLSFTLKLAEMGLEKKDSDRNLGAEEKRDEPSFMNNPLAAIVQNISIAFQQPSITATSPRKSDGSVDSSSYYHQTRNQPRSTPTSEQLQQEYYYYDAKGKRRSAPVAVADANNNNGVPLWVVALLACGLTFAGYFLGSHSPTSGPDIWHSPTEQGFHAQRDQAHQKQQQLGPLFDYTKDAFPSRNLGSDSGGYSYGIDVSWPIYGLVSTNYPNLDHNQIQNSYNEHLEVPPRYRNMPLQVFGDDSRHKAYLRHLDGCRRYYGGLLGEHGRRACDISEYDRLIINKRQVQSMQNYTEVGFIKMRAPPKVQELLKAFWEANKDKQIIEAWPEGNVYTNHWEAPTMMVSVEDSGLRGSGNALKTAIWDATQGSIQAWTGQDVQAVSMYGIRVYTNNAILMPHVNRLPLVISAMVNVAQDVDEDWPVEVYDHDGQAHNVTLLPGEMMLYESHSVIHGRPFPLKGRHFAMLFMHFEPTGHESLRTDGAPDLNEQYKMAVGKAIGGHTATDHSRRLPPYIKEFSPEEEHWQQENPDGWVEPEATGRVTTKEEVEELQKLLNETLTVPIEHRAARTGDVKTLELQLSKAKDENENDTMLSAQKVVNKRDQRGWQPIHEGAAHGRVEVIEWLVHNGANINSRTNGGRGGTPLYLALKRLGEDHPIVNYLSSMGALLIAPDTPGDEL